MTAPSSSRDRGGFAMIAFALVALYLFGIGAILVAVVAVRGDGTSTAASDQATTLNVELTEFKIGGNLTAPAGKVVLNVKNAGTMDHNLAVKGGAQTTKMLSAGSSEQLSLGTLKEGQTLTLICSVPGHEDSGMTATLTVTAAGSSVGGGAGGDMAGGDMAGGDMAGGEMAGMDHSGGGEKDWAKMDADMLASFAAFPAETEGVGNQLLEPTVLPDGTKQFELTAKLAKWEVEPGKVVDAWTYNGMVPAPMIKVNVGDKVRVLFKNELPVNQDIHWHGLEVPFEMDGVAPITQDPVKPGGEFTYEFTMDKPYQAMYHPHLHGQMTVPNGMFGVFQVGETPIAKGITVGGRQIPADVTPAVDIPMVLNDAGVIGLSLNGKSFPATAPIVVNEGDWVAVTYYNEGLMSHPMHLHQFPQLVYARDGIPLDEPYWADTVSVGPGERFSVLVNADEVGTWVWHCHIFSHVERDSGHFGMLTAMVVE